MMKQHVIIKFKFILIGIEILFTSFVFGQTDEDAKLYAIWSDTTKPEIERIEAYFKKFNVWRVYADDTDIGKKWYVDSDKAIQLAIKHGKTGYLPLFYMTSFYNCIIIQKNIKCDDCTELKKVIESAKIANASNYAAYWAYLSLTDTCKTKAKDADIINEFNKIKTTLSGNPEDLQILRQLNSDLGYLFMNKNQYPKALVYSQESLHLSEDLNLIDVLYALDNKILAIIHINTGNYKEAEKYIDKSLQVSHQLKDTFNLGSSYIFKAKLMLKLKDEVEAQNYIDSAMYVMKNVKQCEPCYNYAKTVNAGIKNLSGNHSGALSELNEVEKFFNENNGAERLSSDFFIEKAKAYLGLKRFDDAINILTTSKELGQSFFITASDKYNILVKAYESMGDYKNALDNYKLYVQVEDSLTVLRNSGEVTRLELENQYTQQQLKAELDFQSELNKQKSTRNWLLFIGLAIFLFAIGLFSRLQFIRKTQKLLKRKNEIIEVEKEKAQSSERAKHQFLANMSHEIRTPMNAIKGMTDILIRRDPKDDQKEYLHSIKQSSDSLLVIINDILDISKIEAGKIELENEPFSVNELVDNVHTIMQFKAEEKGLELIKNIPTEHVFVVGDANRLRQILLNLIGNAIKFTEKGHIMTTIKSEKIDGKLNLHFTVSDTGIGIDVDRMDKIFNSFEQAYSDTSRKFGGTGLGLSISKMLVEMHHGNIWVESEKGKSSQFHFTLPYKIAATAAHEPKGAYNNFSTELKGIHILLVEDNPFNVVVAQEELHDAIEGVNVEVAENGAIAVEKINASTFDIILMDVQMPIMNGYEATKAIRAFKNEKSNIPIIAMTANVLKEEVDLCYQAGMNDFIGKPFDTNELIQKIYNLTNNKS